MAGPSAFPLAVPGDCMMQPDFGMELRDWFAGQALPAIVAACVNDTDARRLGHETYFAIKSYALADAMMAARTPVADGEGRS